MSHLPGLAGRVFLPVKGPMVNNAKHFFFPPLSLVFFFVFGSFKNNYNIFIAEFYFYTSEISVLFSNIYDYCRFNIHYRYGSTVRLLSNIYTLYYFKSCSTSTTPQLGTRDCSQTKYYHNRFIREKKKNTKKSHGSERTPLSVSRFS